MEIIPAIDIIDGKCVRLTQGDYSQKKIYNENPLEVALEFESIGIKRLHLVDLDGAKLGKIVNKLEYDTQNLQKHDCLKSFDAKISGKCKGWLFAKMTYDSGGHQDNVFEETYQMCEWFVKYGIKEELYVILIDTNLDKYYFV